MSFGGLYRSAILKAGIMGWLLVLLCTPSQAADIDLERTRTHYLKGNYSDCIRECELAFAEGLRSEEWSLLLVRSQLALGRYAETRSRLLEGLEHNPSSIRLRILGHAVFRANDDLAGARTQLEEINELGGRRIWNYRDPDNFVALGQAALLLGADPKLVLERFFDAARKTDPSCREAWLASGELALEKHDYELAAKLYAEAIKIFPEDPDLHLGLARAYAPSARPQAAESIQAALRVNPRHTPSLLLWVDLTVDAEDYGAADELLDKALAVNPWLPEAWAYRSLLRELQDDPRAAAQARAKALQHWSTNPLVDHLIGRKLSQNYRFREGAARQRQALSFDPGFLPAQLQLAQDLLRLGDETEGWALAQAVQGSDAYDVTAYNLVTLHETLSQFTTLTNDHFIVRMTPHEAGLYGPRVLGLLETARSRLIEKYQVNLERPVIVEIFPEQKDFGVRTFGMPHNPGFLGVCFGAVITANSPASQSQPANWEAVLWHEFAHAITLHLTHNKMPRWLSEGLSVYEERLANPTWGQHMNPRYRGMILDGELTPVGELSAAFLSPKSPLHIQFAYYQSSLVAEYLIERFGWDTLLAVLRDLGEGVTINAALTSRTLPLEDLETGFEAYARQLALSLAPGLDWERPPGSPAAQTTSPADGRRHPNDLGPPAGDGPGIESREPDGRANSQTWSHDRLATNFWALRQRAEAAMETGEWAAAKVPLETLIHEYPDQRGPDNAHALLATVHRALKETDLEKQALNNWAALEADALEAYQRLMQLCAEAGDWPGVALNANRFIAANPLPAQPYLYLAKAGTELGQPEAAVQAWENVLAAGPPDPTEAHFQVAQLLHSLGDPGARQHVLEALEQAPRFREAHRLLLELHREGAASDPPRINSSRAEGGEPVEP